MSLNDRTNEKILLSLHEGAGPEEPAHLIVDVDFDSALDPCEWVFIALTDLERDSESTFLTLEETGLLHDRLGLILGRPRVDDNNERGL